MWVSSAKGISKIELDDNGVLQFIVNYDVKDGLQGYQFIQSSSYKDETGKLSLAVLMDLMHFIPAAATEHHRLFLFQECNCFQ